MIVVRINVRILSQVKFVIYIVSLETEGVGKLEQPIKLSV